MGKHFFEGVASLCIVAATACGTSAIAQPASSSDYADIAKWPDFTTGSWGDGAGPSIVLMPRDFGFNASGGGGGAAPATAPTAGAAGQRQAAPRACRSTFCTVEEAPLTKEYRATLFPSPDGDRNWYNSKSTSCEPMGLVMESGQKFFFAKGVIVIGGVSDYYNTWRRVFMDGRGHPADGEPSYFGHSIGHWEGDTLVIDTVSITQEAKIAAGMKINNYDTHIVERIRLTAPDTLEIKKTITNPGVFTRPVEVVVRRNRIKDYDFPETICWQDTYEEAEIISAKERQ